MKKNHIYSSVMIPLVGLVLVSLLFLAACRREAAPEPTVTPLPAATETRPPVSTATPLPAASATPDLSGAWSQIQQRGRLNIGTSGDYPPFAFYNDQFQLSGYDIALSRAIGENLNIPIELKDMSFDGLAGALQVGQIDAAIAAISVTEARRAQMDFSVIYFVSQDAILARAGAGFTITKLEDMAPFRVAVQDGTVFETWLQEAVEAGQLPADNLFVYVETGKAIEDLTEGLVDLVIADSPPLQLLARNDAFEIVGQGLNEERYAVAVPKGSNLLPLINQALFDLQNNGTLDSLAEQYLNLSEDELVPLPTPQPTPISTATSPPPTAEVVPPTSCVDSMAFVQDLNLNDQNMTAPPSIAPGLAFQKSWRIRNTGSCTWDSNYMLTPVDGNVPQARMGGQPTPIRGQVLPGQTYDITVDLVAPLTPGVYQGFWTMRNRNGLLFGDRIWVGISVPAPPTPTPLPTATPSPGMTFTVDRSSIRAGECVTFRWQTQGASQTFLYAQGQPWQQHLVANSGSQQECPPVTTIYDLRVIFVNGNVEIRNIRIDVQPAVGAPVIDQFSVAPGFQITAGQCVDVRWLVSGQVSGIRVARNNQSLWDEAPLGGTSRDCPPVGEAVYTIEARGPGGISRAQQVLTVLPEPTPVPQATATPLPPPTQAPTLPVIFSFNVSPNQIAAGQCVTIAWSVGGSVERVQIKRDAVVVLDFATLSGNATDCPANSGVITYRVEATNYAGQQAFQQAAVTVGSPPPAITGNWRLTGMNGAGIIPGSEINAVFGDNNNLSGSAGCNSYNASYQTSGAGLSITIAGTTQLFCDQPAGVMEQESTYIMVLSNVTGFEIQGNQLTITSTRGRLQFERLQIGPR